MAPEMTPKILERVLRHYAEFQAFYEKTGQDEISMPGGVVINIHDVLQGIDELPPRQRTALVLTCLMNLKEAEAASIMGLKKWTSPVGTYKKLALQKLCEKHWGNGSNHE